MPSEDNLEEFVTIGIYQESRWEQILFSVVSHSMNLLTIQQKLWGLIMLIVINGSYQSSESTEMFLRALPWAGILLEPVLGNPGLSYKESLEASLSHRPKVWNFPIGRFNK